MIYLLYIVSISDWRKRSDNREAGTSPPGSNHKNNDVGKKERVGFPFYISPTIPYPHMACCLILNDILEARLQFLAILRILIPRCVKDAFRNPRAILQLRDSKQRQSIRSRVPGEQTKQRLAFRACSWQCPIDEVSSNGFRGTQRRVGR